LPKARPYFYAYALKTIEGDEGLQTYLPRGVRWSKFKDIK